MGLLLTRNCSGIEQEEMEYLNDEGVRYLFD